MKTKTDPLAPVSLWIVDRGVGHAIRHQIGAARVAYCGKREWHKPLIINSTPRRVCSECRGFLTVAGPKRPRLDVAPVVERQLAFGADWGSIEGMKDEG